jgi:hypothetical protein
VRLAFNLNTNQIRELLISLKKRREFSKKWGICFYDRNAWGGRKNTWHWWPDFMNISEIVDIFSEINCPNLRNKPKLFFFNCCRISNDWFEKLTLFSNSFYFSYRKRTKKGGKDFGQRSKLSIGENIGWGVEE